VESLHETEQAPVHTTWQTALEPQETEALLPAVMEQVEASHERLALSPAWNVHWLPPLQSALQDRPQVPVQVLPSRQRNEQLSPEQPELVQVAPAAQVQVFSEQVHAAPGQADDTGAELHAVKERALRRAMRRMGDSSRARQPASYAPSSLVLGWTRGAPS
jgi:hypothetical protein